MAIKTQEQLVDHLRARGVLKSPLLIAAFRAIDRAHFVPTTLHVQAYEDHPLPIGHGQTISQPWTVAFMLELLQPQPHHTILDIGAGSGWQTALLAYIVAGLPAGSSPEPASGKVVAIEVIPDLAQAAQKNLRHYPQLNQSIDFHVGDARLGYPAAAPFQKIIAAAAGSDVPQAWLDQLDINGVLVVPLNNSIEKIVKVSPQKFTRTSYPGFAFVPLV